MAPLELLVYVPQAIYTFCVLECCGSLSQDYMTIYTAVIGFYFGTQSKKDEDV